MGRPKKSEAKFALVWWTESKTTDVVPIGVFGNKSKRSVGMTSKIRWQDSKTKLIKTYDATIRALGGKLRLYGEFFYVVTYHLHCGM